MIKRKLKICKVCGEPKYLFSKGMCRYCYNKEMLKQRDVRSIPVKRPESPVKPLSTKSNRIHPLSPKRANTNQEYNAIVKKMKDDAREDKDAVCFFCGGHFKERSVIDCHHIFGREGEKLVDRENLVLVHRECHSKYHSLSVHKINWYPEWLERIKDTDPKLYEKEIIKYNKD